RWPRDWSSDVCSSDLFDEDVRIYVQSQFNYFDGQAEWIWKPEPGAAQIASRTVSLLGATIESFEGHEDGTLRLNLSNGRRLTIRSEERRVGKEGRDRR